jgi:L-rhamnose mutarotase
MKTAPERHGGVLRLRPGCYDEYKRYHDRVWPEVLSLISSCHIRNYSIFHHDGLLFGFFEYWGDDFQADMERMKADPVMRRWWDLMEPMQEPLPTRAEGERWARMEEVFRHE